MNNAIPMVAGAVLWLGLSPAACGAAALFWRGAHAWGAAAAVLVVALYLI